MIFLLISMLVTAAHIAEAECVGWISSGSLGGITSSLTVAPTTPSTVYGAGRDSGVFRSVAGTGIWDFPATDAQPYPGSAVAFDPAAPGTLFAGTIHGGTRGAVSKSTDAGTTWVFENAGLELVGFVTTFAIDPLSTSTIYVGSYGDGVFKSTDGGVSWSKTSGPHNILTLVIDPGTPTTLYAATGEYAILSAGLPGTVLKTTDAGASWQPSGHGLFATVAALAIDPHTPATLYAGTVETVVKGGAGSSISKTTDGGRNWIPLTTGLPSNAPGVFALAIDPQNPSTIYAGTAKGIYTGDSVGVMKTTDAGTTWSILNGGLPPTDVTTLAVDPAAPATIYAGTKSGEVFTFAQVAEPSSPEPPALCCIGDCHGDGQVTVDDLLLCIRIGLGVSAAPCLACDVDRDNRVTIDEIMAAVHNALVECPQF